VVITLCGQKGGSGKTTVAIAAAAELHARGLRVLLVDADPQRTASTWAEVAIESGHTDRTPTVVGMGGRMHLAGQLDKLARDYDVAVIDCPPAFGDIQRSALQVADFAVIPCTPSPYDVWALAGSVALVGEVQASRPRLRAALLLNRTIEGTHISASTRAALEKLAVPLMRTELHARVAYAEAGAAGLGVAQYLPRDPAAAEIRSLVDELQELAHGQKKTRHRTPKASRRQD
jgi:chromosome partitioning protein